MERLLSLVTGVGLSLAALRRGTLVGRSAASAAGAMLIARGVTAYCPVKGAVAGDASLQDGLREQWSRLRSGAAQEIDSLGALYISELQELHSAETQLARFLKGLPVTNAAFARLLEGYDTEVHSRVDDLAHLLRINGADPHRHADQAMRALLFETRKLSNVGSSGVREAAVLSSLQRVLHFKIAGYGTVATYAKQLGRMEEASQLAGYGDRDKQLDAELTQTAASVVNLRAERRPLGAGAAGVAGSGARGGAAAGVGSGDAAGATVAARAPAAPGVATSGSRNNELPGAGAGALGASGAEAIEGAGAAPAGGSGAAREPQGGRPH